MTLLIVLACSNEQTDVFDENAIRGGLVTFTNGLPDTRINLLKIDEYVFSEDVEDPNKNIISYDLTLTYGNISVDKFITITSFPNTLEFTGPELLDALGLSEDQLDTSESLEFTAIITTTTGVFNGALSDFDVDTAIQNGGDSGTRLLLSNAAFNQAISFGFNFFIPPPKKLRGTSFEEPSAGSGRYSRPDGVANDAEGPLLNNPGDSNVMYVAQGTGTDDELGFTAEFIDTGRGGFASELMGVTSSSGDVGAFVDGNQGYRLRDSDGIIRITFDRVVVPSNITSSGVQIQFYIPNVGNNMESSDSLNVYAIIEKNGTEETLELLNEDGLVLNSMRDAWNLIDSGLLDDIEAYTLVVEHDTNDNDERIYFDQMLVYIPE
ncbi:hypothetical protein GCM10022396_40260 [Flavivirga amylovorans]